MRNVDLNIPEPYNAFILFEISKGISMNLYGHGIMMVAKRRNTGGVKMNSDGCIRSYGNNKKMTGNPEWKNESEKICQNGGVDIC